MSRGTPGLHQLLPRVLRTGTEGVMARLRTVAIVLASAGAAIAIPRHTRGSGGLETRGGIIMGDAPGCDSLSAVLLGSFYGSVAADVAAAAHTGGQILDVG
jgi:hypothetical protein